MAKKEWARIALSDTIAVDKKLELENGVLHDDKLGRSYVILNPPRSVATTSMFGEKRLRVYEVADATGTSFESPDVQAFIRELAARLGVQVDPAIKLSGITFLSPTVAVDRNGKPVEVMFRGKMNRWNSDVAHAVTRWTLLKGLKAKMKRSMQEHLPWLILSGALLIIVLALIWAARG